MKLLLHIFFSLLSLPLLAQEVSNVQVQQEGEELKVIFDLSGSLERYLINIEFAEDGKHFHLLGQAKAVPGKNSYSVKEPLYSQGGIFRATASFGPEMVFVAGRGFSLDMAGWRWNSRPNVNDPSDEEGKIVFQIKVDGYGTIVSLNVLEKTVSPALVNKYRKEVEELTFSRTSGGSDGEGATGRITFIFTSR